MKGGAAFPTGFNSGSVAADPGMSLRDYFAAKAMQSFMLWSLNDGLNDEIRTREQASELYAKVGYEIADAMLKERDK